MVVWSCLLSNGTFFSHETHWHIGAWTKLFSFCRWHFQVHFLEWKPWHLALCEEKSPVVFFFLRFSSQRASNAELWWSLCCYHEYKLWNKQLSCQWFETPWRLCDITAMHLVHTSRLILGLRPANNERRRYKVTASLIGWAQTWTGPPPSPPNLLVLKEELYCLFFVHFTDSSPDIHGGVTHSISGRQ